MACVHRGEVRAATSGDTEGGWVRLAAYERIRNRVTASSYKICVRNVSATGPNTRKTAVLVAGLTSNITEAHRTAASLLWIGKG